MYLLFFNIGNFLLRLINVKYTRVPKIVYIYNFETQFG